MSEQKNSSAQDMLEYDVANTPKFCRNPRLFIYYLTKMIFFAGFQLPAYTQKLCTVLVAVAMHCNLHLVDLQIAICYMIYLSKVGIRQASCFEMPCLLVVCNSKEIEYFNRLGIRKNIQQVFLYLLLQVIVSITPCNVVPNINHEMDKGFITY